MTRSILRTVYGLACIAVFAAGVALVVGGCNAWRDWLGPNRLIVPLWVDRPATAQLFYDQGQGIRAEDCASVSLPGGGTALHELAFPVPRAALRELRFDPMIAVGKFTIGAPRLESASGRVIARFPLTAVVPRQQIAGWQREGDRWLGTTETEANDPQLTFGLGGPLRVGSPRIPWIELLFLLAAGGAWGWLRRRKALRGWRFLPAAEARLAVVRGWITDPARGGWLAGPGRLMMGPGSLLTGAVLVAALQLWLLWPLHRVMDWPLWDETNYAARGLAWATHGGSLDALNTSPLYVVMYAGLSWLGDVGSMVCAQHYVVPLTATVLLYFILARWWRSPMAATAAALLWAMSSFQLEWPILVYQAAWLWFLAAVLTADRWPLAALGFALLAACVRQEYQFTAMALLAWHGWRAWRQKYSWRDWLGRGGRWPGWAVLAAAVWAGVVFVLLRTDLSMRHSDERLWFAFEQHYAARAASLGEVKGLNPWLDYKMVTRHDFPGANSLSAAWRVNAAGVKHHLIYNLTHFGGELASLWRCAPGLRPAAWALLAAALLAMAGRRAARTPASGGERPGDSRSASAVLAASALLAVAPGLIVLAKESYLLALVPGVFGAVALLWSRATRGTVAWRAGLGVAALGLLTLGVVMLIRAPQPFEPGDRPRPVAETVAELEKIWPTTGREALLGVAAISYAQYLGEDRCQAIEALTGVSNQSGEDVPIERVLAETKPLAVLVTADWRASQRFDGAKLARLLAAPEWTVRTVPAGQLYVRTGR
ncbi:MAG: hypothetical protein JSS11_14730 [Verrucomicrobia bacterium]|nr:hypothetical protein [Verrucomicrobiota bacterium]